MHSTEINDGSVFERAFEDSRKEMTHGSVRDKETSLSSAEETYRVISDSIHSSVRIQCDTYLSDCTITHYYTLDRLHYLCFFERGREGGGRREERVLLFLWRKRKQREAGQRTGRSERDEYSDWSPPAVACLLRVQ